MVNVREAGTVAGEQQVVQGGLPVRNERVQALNAVLTQLRGLQGNRNVLSLVLLRTGLKGTSPFRLGPGSTVVVASGEGATEAEGVVLALEGAVVALGEEDDSEELEEQAASRVAAPIPNAVSAVRRVYRVDIRIFLSNVRA